MSTPSHALTPMPRLRTPVVLVHGLLGFSQVDVAGRTLVEYFPGIASAMRSAGNRVFVAWLPPTEGVAERAARLCRFIREHSPGEPVHVIAHSMGGLDARYMIAKL